MRPKQSLPSCCHFPSTSRSARYRKDKDLKSLWAVAQNGKRISPCESIFFVTFFVTFSHNFVISDFTLMDLMRFGHYGRNRGWKWWLAKGHRKPDQPRCCNRDQPWSHGQAISIGSLRWFPSKRTRHRFPMKLCLLSLQHKEMLKT